MKTIKKQDYIFEVDIEKTIEYYKTHSLCDCDCCENFYAQIKETFPILGEFLSEFGVDITRPDEIFSTENDNVIEYLGVYYSVCGKITSLGQSKFDICDSQSLKIEIDGFSPPNEQTGDYFTISVSNVFELPWVLDKPFPIKQPFEMPNKVKGFFRKIFKSNR